MRRARSASLLTLAILLTAAVPAASQAPRSDTSKPTAKKSVAGKKVEAKKPGRPAEQQPATASEATAPPQEAPRPFDPQLTRLAETIGALAFLRELCNAGDGGDWREKMTSLLDADAPTGARRQRLIAAYNHGFRGFELTYRTCTPNAEAAVDRYIAEADRITADIAYRYSAQ